MSVILASSLLPLTHKAITHSPTPHGATVWQRIHILEPYSTWMSHYKLQTKSMYTWSDKKEKSQNSGLLLFTISSQTFGFCLFGFSPFLCFWHLILGIKTNHSPHPCYRPKSGRHTIVLGFLNLVRWGSGVRKEQSLGWQSLEVSVCQRHKAPGRSCHGGESYFDAFRAGNVAHKSKTKQNWVWVTAEGTLLLTDLMWLIFSDSGSMWPDS
jgi:hypothetical protein